MGEGVPKVIIQVGRKIYMSQCSSLIIIADSIHSLMVTIKGKRNLNHEFICTLLL